MAIRARTAEDIKKLHDMRRREPSSRYNLAPHERRELAIMAKKVETLDRKALRDLANYFCVTLGTIAQNLQSAGFEIDHQGASQKQERPEPKKKKKHRAKLGIGGIVPPKPKPLPKAKDVAIAGESDELRETRNDLELLKSRIILQQRELAARERELERREREAAQTMQEAEEAMHGADMKAEELDEVIKQVRQTQRVPRPDVESERLYSYGMVLQMLQAGFRERDVRNMELLQLVSALRQERDEARREAKGLPARVDSDQIESMLVM